MVSQADRELINNFVNELRPYLETVETGVQQFAQPNRDGVTVGQAVQALMMVRGAGQILMVDGLVSIASWLVESFEKIQNNPGIAPAEATRRLSGLYSAMEDFLVALDRGEDVDPIVLRARTIFEAIPAFGGPLPGTGRLRPRTDLDALFGDDDRTAPTDRISPEAAADTEKLPKTSPTTPPDQMAEMPEAMPTVPLQSSPDAATRRVTDQPARIVPVPPQPTEELPAVDPELREIFEEEALDIITAFGDGIRELARNPSDLEAIRNLNRAAHTLKGAANMTGFPLIAQIGAAIEHLFDEQLDRNHPVGRDVLELVAVSWKMLRAMLPKLDDLSSFTSPSNSIVQRANVLREQLAQAVADAETIPMDERHYGPSRSAEEPAAQDMDEIVEIDVQVPELDLDYTEIDARMVEAAPTVPLNKDAGATPAVDLDTKEIPVVELDETDAVVEDDVIYDDFEPVAADAFDKIETGPFWVEEDTLEEPVAIELDRPQSEPFWTPGTEELMRAVVHTDRLIAELHGIDELVGELTEDVLDGEEDSFFTGVDSDESGQPQSIEVNEGEWLDAPDGPGTDLLNFDHAPQTEPFWKAMDDVQPELVEELVQDEPVTMDPFFEPVETPTSFFHSSNNEEEPEPLTELEADIFDAPEVEVDEAIPATETGEAATPTDESTTDYEAPAPDDLVLVAEAQPLEAVQPVDLTDIPEPVEVEASSYEETFDDGYSYEYAFDFELDLDPASDVEASEAPQVGTLEIVAEIGELPCASEPDTSDETATHRDPGQAIVPAFASSVAELLAGATLDIPELPWEPEEVEAVSEEPAVVQSEAIDAPAFDEAHWAELEAPIPADVVAMATDSVVSEFEGIDPADDEWAFVAESPESIEAGDDILLELEAAASDSHDTGTDDDIGEMDNDYAEDIVVEADQDAEVHDEIDDRPVDEDVVIDDTPDIAASDVADNGEPEAEDVPAEAADELMTEAAVDALHEFDDVVAGMEEDGLGDLDWFEQPEPTEPEPALDDHATSNGHEAASYVPSESPGTGFLSKAGTGFLRDPGTSSLRDSGTDPLGFGSLDLDRFLTHEGSVALSSALLDMAFTAPAGDQLDGSGTTAISVFDENSERALEIEMFETFALEAEDHLAALSRAAMQLDRDPFATEPVIDIKRALHTMKGAAAAADFGAISEMAHDLEDALATQERLGTLGDRTFATQLFSAIEEIEAGIARRKDELFGAGDDEQSAPTLRVEIGHVDDMLNTVGELVVNRSSFEERLERLETTIEDLSTAAARLQRSSYLLEREANAEDAIGRLLRGELNGRDGRLIIDGAQRDWDTLEMDRYTEFDRLIRQLAEVGADVSTAVGEIASLRGDFDTISTRQRRLTTALQDELMGIRMVPISSLAPRLYRVVRRAAGRRGKEVSLSFEGGDTPFDKILLDTLSESLLHLLRNAVDHGIEDVDERRRLGKPEHGAIRIRAFRDGSEAVIEIIDDGAGIDHQAVIQHARERGMSVSDNITREAALALIFEPGFSTRSEADEISGRGLGLEIVQQTVARYKGRVAVDSVPGRGTIFSLRLPVMLSVIQAFLVTAGDGEFAIPVANVDYVVDRIDQPLTQIGESVVVEASGQIIPVVDVGARLGRSQTPVLEKRNGWIMVTEIGGKRWALVVDELRGQQEIVVKPLGRFLRAMPGLMGATILGHGDVALIVDVPALLGADSLVTRLNSVALPASSKSAGLPRLPDRATGDGQARVVLIVDDSLSVRRVVSRTIERRGWVAVLARDGVEALEMLEQGQVDIVLTDIEMPRMDGFELVSAIRGQGDLSDLPIVVLTSRSGEKHRERALSLGANEYLVKPFQEQELIDVVESVSRVSSRV